MAVTSRLSCSNQLLRHGGSHNDQGATALIVDYKTGRGEVTPSKRNLQLLALAVLLKENYPKVRKVHAAILQTREPVEVATFTTKQLRAGKELIMNILEIALTPSARRFAGRSNVSSAGTRRVAQRRWGR